MQPTLVNTIDALKSGNVAKAEEVYINTRDRDMYNELKKNYQAKIEEG